MLSLKRIWLDKDKKTYNQWLELMKKSSLNPTKEQIDYTVGIFDDDKLVATGSYEGKILKCLAVCKDYQSENLLTQILVHLLEKMRAEEVNHFLVYTKPENEDLFTSLGFHKIIGNDQIIFMEQGFPDFNDYEKLLESKKVNLNTTASGIVMNANPFTRGHQYLIETAASQSEHVYVFVLSEDKSYFSTKDRVAMVELGTAHLDNVTVLPTADYIVSSATFPSYFLKDEAELDIARKQASLDAKLFKDRIAKTLNISKRFVGEEPYSAVTEIYNESMRQVFGNELELVVLPRIDVGGNVISATKVRAAIKENDYILLGEFLPTTTYNYLKEHKEL
ncbi:[citrate (pro-3S)-lyase] ligase [Floricoccus penangensis]|uniref:[Citrate [pro-3S]-lyase] ligase n=1 Tax=Floricoccus penangensis TaxID=1859475 RepID=A0A9Q5P057_9LACT|nr:[citrate (pro-3S)-lyase] ligase [Floricoccus penangensis]OFI46487.1 [citrate (pro-3S)-lyase] ligase [Floricoccus penangensis]URZ87244.1 [citrate (pro-3S)-lyase] ligase [Floricoccus penangensis]